MLLHKLKSLFGGLLCGVAHGEQVVAQIIRYDGVGGVDSVGIVEQVKTSVDVALVLLVLCLNQNILGLALVVVARCGSFGGAFVFACQHGRHHAHDSQCKNEIS